ncbi:HK97 gp10 family phage protein [Rhodococcus pseudokoreensis]|uniref:HK97 gp10 family phage protein n=1 Tax=Rhodococcus pseudokoreensis TaxID=2811421 RepID=A0A974ZXZ7_9NOCA|nr:HK97 gp10 family phage protein [Rhodococcus pseudokoreensis]QSE94196.1 HK97 gp10 family phage protein [Rhodococcus pseudokoreensis]
MVARLTIYDGRARAETFEISFEDRLEIGWTIADESRADAPVLTGDYRDGITVETDGQRVFVADTDEDAVFKEYGTVDTPPHAVLTNKARRYGDYRGWEPK